MYTEQKFTIPELKGISAKSIETHIKLYAGYVKFANVILEKINEYKADAEKHAYALGEIQRPVPRRCRHCQPIRTKSQRQALPTSPSWFRPPSR